MASTWEISFRKVEEASAAAAEALRACAFLAPDAIPLAVYRRLLGEEHPVTLQSMHNLCFVLEEGDGMEVDQEMVKALLEGVRKLPEGTPIRVAAEKRWGSFGE